MKTLMYPIAPEGDFPETFCAIRLHNDERRFYTPEGESANELLHRMSREATEKEDTIKNLTDNNVRFRVYNAMLRELVDELIDLAKAVKADSKRLAELERHARNLEVEVDG